MGATQSQAKRGDYIASVDNGQDGEKDPVNSLCLVNDDSVATVGESIVRIWSIGTAKLRKTMKLRGGPCYGISVSPNGGNFAVASYYREVPVWRENDVVPQYLKGHTDSVCCTTFLSDLELITGSADSTIRIWDLNDGKSKIVLSGHEGPVLCIAIHKNSQLLVSGSADHSVKVWNLDNYKLHYTLTGHTDEVRTVAISPDGANIVSASFDTTIRLWHRRTGKEGGLLAGEQGGIKSLCFCDNGNLLVSGGVDGSINVWRFAQGKLIATLHGHAEEITTLASPSYNPQDTHVKLLSGSLDGTLKIWFLPHDPAPPPEKVDKAEKSEKIVEPTPVTVGQDKVIQPKEVPKTEFPERVVHRPGPALPAPDPLTTAPLPPSSHSLPTTPGVLPTGKRVTPGVPTVAVPQLQAARTS
eukprot:TRINITY_DN2146_c0_g1_i1.p1 TRINITY_DN2146_c0_g1~~TRINITY_DN2146_c0_g1_i1.p1  ORF type:complete len:413 (-),score=42.78 TRINITY_DN2146_c0_g1_i1:14-1252(-)